MDGIMGEASAEEPLTADAAATAVDNRGEGRKVVFEGVGTDCVVENISDGGARVRFGIPDPAALSARAAVQ